MSNLTKIRLIIGCFAVLLLVGCETVDSVDYDDSDDAEVDGRVASSGHTSNNLLPNEQLVANQYLKSTDGSHRLYLQSDGNLVLRRMSDSKALWASGTNGKSATRFKFQSDGNLVLRTASGAAVWSSKTAGSGATQLQLHSTGALVLNKNSTAVWSVNGSSNPTDQCPNDPNKTVPGVCGCGVPEGSCSGDVVNASTLKGKVMAGYQGWFYAKNDGGYNKWNHWCNSSQDKPKPSNVLFDIWPDLREFPSNELYPTGFTYANGKNAGLYSAHNASTVERHMKWSREYNIDGVFVQRFMASIHDGLTASRDKVLLNVKNGAEKYGRVFVNMWDINSLESKGSDWHNAGLVEKIKKDWMHLVDDLHITSSNRYLKHNGKPLVAIWGVSKMEVMDAQYANELVEWFHKNAAPKYQASVMLGVTNEVGSSNVDWRKKSSSWQNVFRKVDVISPWTVGRFNSESGADNFYNDHIKPDKQKCDEYGVDYFPVVFPGFSACQKHSEKACNACPRKGGKLFWRQFYNVMMAGSEMVYVAMFDEVDEGTAIYKLAENQSQTPVQIPSNGENHEFIAMDSDGYKLPSDWYLRLTGEAGKMLRKETGLTSTIPIKP